VIEVRWAQPTLTAVQRDHAIARLTLRERSRELSENFLAGRLLLKSLVTELTGDPDPVVEQTCVDCGGAHGRPTYAGLWLSLSRCAEGVVAAAASEPVGIDVELAAAEGAGGTIQHWTQTEAVLKADGRGLRVDADRVVFARNTARIDGRGIRYSVIDLDLDESLQVSLAVAEDASGTASARTGRRAIESRTLLQVHGSRSW
jgi:4'-phosphopantetheinyl transferase